MRDSTAEPIRSFCNGCQRETRHEMVGSCSRQRREGNGQFARFIHETWHLLQCCGCESIKAFVSEDSTDFKTPRQTHYPACQNRQLPGWRELMPQKCQDLICETYAAMHADCLTLSMMGTRAILDEILKEMVEDCGGFQKKLQQAAKEGFLTTAEIEVISAAIDAGNAASHRGFRPTVSQLDDALDIVEHTLMNQYVLAAASGRLKKSVPPRKGIGD
jgi:hypothetical protein